VKLD
jgi:hypothetical protein